jgi:hypothetical protein
MPVERLTLNVNIWDPYIQYLEGLGPQGIFHPAAWLFPEYLQTRPSDWIGLLLCSELGQLPHRSGIRVNKNLMPWARWARETHIGSDNVSPHKVKYYALFSTQIISKGPRVHSPISAEIMGLTVPSTRPALMFTELVPWLNVVEVGGKEHTTPKFRIAWDITRSYIMVWSIRSENAEWTGANNEHHKSKCWSLQCSCAGVQR